MPGGLLLGAGAIVFGGSLGADVSVALADAGGVVYRDGGKFGGVLGGALGGKLGGALGGTLGGALGGALSH